MITVEIEYTEKRDVVMIYIPSAFIQTKQPDNKKVIACLGGRMAEIMCIIAPGIYQPYV